MKIKLLIGLTLAAVATSSMALEIHNGKLLSHKQWGTGKATNVIFKEVSLESNVKYAKFLEKAKRKIDAGDEHVISVIHVDHVKDAKMGDNIQLSGGGRFYIVNDTAESKDYKVVTSLCSYWQMSCSLSEDQIMLAPNGYAASERELALTQTYPVIDDYESYYDWVEMNVYVDKMGIDKSVTTFSAATEEEVWLTKDTNPQPEPQPVPEPPEDVK